VDEVAMGGIERMKEMQGVNMSIFARATPEIMERLLAYADVKYGGMSGYMTQIGFDEQQQARLKRHLVEEAW
jgi:hypothetical protein